MSADFQASNAPMTFEEEMRGRLMAIERMLEAIDV